MQGTPTGLRTQGVGGPAPPGPQVPGPGPMVNMPGGPGPMADLNAVAVSLIANYLRLQDTGVAPLLGELFNREMVGMLRMAQEGRIDLRQVQGVARHLELEAQGGHPVLIDVMRQFKLLEHQLMERHVAIEQQQFLEQKQLMEQREHEALQQQLLAVHQQQQQAAEVQMGLKQQKILEETQLLEQKIQQEKQRIFEQQQMAEQRKRLAEQEERRLQEQQQAEQQKRLMEEQRLAAEKKRLEEEQMRQNALRLAEQRQAEQQKRLLEEQRLAAEQKRLEEEQMRQNALRLAEQRRAEQQKRLMEEQRLAAEQKRLQEQRRAEQHQRLLEEQRLAAEQKRLEEQRMRQNALRLAEEQKKVEEEQMLQNHLHLMNQGVGNAMNGMVQHAQQMAQPPYKRGRFSGDQPLRSGGASAQDSNPNKRMQELQALLSQQPDLSKQHYSLQAQPAGPTPDTSNSKVSQLQQNLLAQIEHLLQNPAQVQAPNAQAMQELMQMKQNLEAHIQLQGAGQNQNFEPQNQMSCPKGHSLKSKPAHFVRCDNCKQNVENGKIVHSCDLCDHDVCDDCFTKEAKGKMVSRQNQSMAQQQQSRIELDQMQQNLIGLVRQSQQAPGQMQQQPQQALAPGGVQNQEISRGMGQNPRPLQQQQDITPSVQQQPMDLGLTNTEPSGAPKSGGPTSLRSKKLYLYNLPLSLGDASLLSYLSDFGKCLDLRVLPDAEAKGQVNIGYAEFDSVVAACTCKKALETQPPPAAPEVAVDFYSGAPPSGPGMRLVLEADASTPQQDSFFSTGQGGWMQNSHSVQPTPEQKQEGPFQRWSASQVQQQSKAPWQQQAPAAQQSQQMPQQPIPHGNTAHGTAGEAPAQNRVQVRTWPQQLQQQQPQPSAPHNQAQSGNRFLQQMGDWQLHPWQRQHARVSGGQTQIPSQTSNNPNSVAVHSSSKKNTLYRFD